MCMMFPLWPLGMIGLLRYEVKRNLFDIESSFPNTSAAGRRASITARSSQSSGKRDQRQPDAADDKVHRPGSSQVVHHLDERYGEQHGAGDDGASSCFTVSHIISFGCGCKHFVAAPASMARSRARTTSCSSPEHWASAPIGAPAARRPPARECAADRRPENCIRSLG